MTGVTDPAIVAAEVASQISFLRNLKFQYLEQKAKVQYIKTIVSDDAPNINGDDNERLRLVNEQKKEVLAAAKSRLAEKHADIQHWRPSSSKVRFSLRYLRSLIFHLPDYNKAKALTHEASSLATKILDARLKLTRLRQAHPHPRLTIPAANAQLDSQVVEMQQLEDELQTVSDKVERVKEKVKQGSKEVERLRMQRADLDKLVKVGKDEVEDGRVLGLYDWFTATLALHRSLFSLESSHSVSENELHLTYSISSSSSEKKRQVAITLLFVPNTRRLADAQVEGLSTDVGDVVGAHVQANDVPGLLAAVLARARAEG
ncbi:hypothetical protein A0H81_06132 [Grifola frondosa]|uniref:Kinetochore protein Sos7 coiled-coil domain-containing protein n=1 Tax=Grifola frondosa TaxID=5627 RepID=A0A1C7MBR3_GRIFR|nr:hypothetical protein A0H81_06132 [Grifola frondosa]